MQAAVLQPGYLPWLGFFDQLYKSDVFVVYDDVQYDKHGWRNRNRIKTPQGVQWLTVPVFSKGLPLIKDIKIDNKENWGKKHLQGIKQNYSKAPFFDRYIGFFEGLYDKEWNYLIDLDMEIIDYFTDTLGIKTKRVFSSELGISGTQTERLIDVCRHFNADSYLTGDSAKNYLDENLFKEAKIELIYHNYKHPPYRQLYGEFIPYLSAVDLFFNEGDKSLEIFTNGLSLKKETSS